jgi:hypothetical protein
MKLSPRPLRLLPLLALCLGPRPALSHGTSAGYSNQGLKLLTTENIHRVKEDLFVSPGRIRVRYTFENPTTQPIQARVAFPLPDTELLLEGEVSEVSGFTLSVAGQRHATHRETVYKVQGREYRGPDALKAQKLIQQEQQRRRAGGRPTDDFTASVQHSEVWEQRFAPGEQLEVEIAYRPSISGDLGWDQRTYKHRRVRENFCLDTPTRKGLDKALRRTGDAAEDRRRLQWLSYVLVSGDNWAGPIGQFHLTLEKPDPGSLLSTCIEGLEKTSPVRFELTRENFRPAEDLDVIFFRP